MRAAKPGAFIVKYSKNKAEMDHQQTHSAKAHPGLIVGLASMAKNLFGLLVNRIELASVELAEVRSTLITLTVVFGLGIIAVWFAVAYWSMLIVLLTWDTLGWKILLIIALVFTFAAIGIFRYAQALLSQGRLSMPATLAELRSDRDALLQTPRE